MGQTGNEAGARGKSNRFVSTIGAAPTGDHEMITISVDVWNHSPPRAARRAVMKADRTRVGGFDYISDMRPRLTLISNL